MFENSSFFKENKNKIIYGSITVFIIIIIIIIISLTKTESFTTLQKQNDEISQLKEKVDEVYSHNSFISVPSNECGSEYSLTYGELTFEGMENIVSYLNQNNLSRDTFIDLGSGNGRTLFYSILAGFKNAKGVEIVEKRHNFAIEAYKQLKPYFKNNIDIVKQDIFKLEQSFFPKNSLIFVSNLVYPSQTNEKLFKYLYENTPEDVVLVVSKIPIDLSSFKEVTKIKVPMSWAYHSECYILTK